MKTLVASLFCLLLVTHMSLALATHTLTIAVASNFESTFKQLKPLFETRYKITVNSAFGSTGKLYTQIIHGAPFDVFLSGDKEHVIKLEKKGLSMPITRFMYAKGELVLYAPGKKVSEHGLTQLLSLHMKHIAIANPLTAPYGLAAMQYLKRSDLLPVLKSKLIIAENIGQVATFLVTGNVDAGFIASSQLIDIINHSRHPISAEEIWRVPQFMYEPLTQYATLVASSHSPREAKAFLIFLKSATAQKIITKNGYRL